MQASSLSGLVSRAMQRTGGGWAGLVLGPLLLAVLFLFLTWHFTFARIDHEEEATVQEAIHNNADIAAVVKANLEQILNRTGSYAALSSSLLGGERGVAAHINPTINGDRAYLRLAVFRDSGQLLHSSARQRAEPELAAFVNQATQGWRHIPPPSALLIGRSRAGTGAWRVPLLVGIHTGEAQGVLAAVLDLGYFLQLFQDVHLGVSGSIEIIGTDGYQLVEGNGGTLSAGRDYLDSAYLRFLQSASDGAGVVRRGSENPRSIAAFNRLEKYPLIVTVSKDYGEVMAGFERRRQGYLRWAALVSVLLLVITASLIRLARHQYAIHKALVSSEDDNLKLIEQLEDEKNKAYQLASHDHLTGLPNRILFVELAASHILRARRSRNLHAVLFIDLDRFKTVNDTLGHRVGDLLLVEVARRLRACLRGSDVVSRFGGDEFVMLINDVKDTEDIAKIADKIVKSVGEPIANLDGHTVDVSPSIGIAIYPQDGEVIDVLLMHADAAMYSAKEAGRGTYRFNDMALNKQALHQMELLRALPRAIREEQFVLHYQARVKSDDFSLVGLEALVRWQHPEHGLIFPNEFIALAENNDLITPLGLWVVNAACRQLAEWRRRGLPLVPVAVNISAKQFRSDSLVADICAAMERHDIPPNLLEVEITESCVVDAPERVAAILKALVAHGIRVAMDDYGTGFASLGYMKMMPLHAIKIDRSFVREIRNDNSDAMIVASTVTLAHNLKLLVIAEGVESRDQLILLKTMGCDEIQGYYFHRPVPAGDVEPILRQGRFLV